MSVEISSDILVVREKCRWKFQRHFSCERKMSVEISSDILAVREKCRWKFQRHFSFERKLDIQNKFHCQFLEKRL